MPRGLDAVQTWSAERPEERERPQYVFLVGDGGAEARAHRWELFLRKSRDRDEVCGCWLCRSHRGGGVTKFVACDSIAYTAMRIMSYQSYPTGCIRVSCKHASCDCLFVAARSFHRDSYDMCIECFTESGE